MNELCRCALYCSLWFFVPHYVCFIHLFGHIVHKMNCICHFMFDLCGRTPHLTSKYDDFFLISYSHAIYKAIDVVDFFQPFTRTYICIETILVWIFSWMLISCVKQSCTSHVLVIICSVFLNIFRLIAYTFCAILA